MTSQLELHLLERLDAIANGVARLEVSLDSHLKSHVTYDEAKLFQANLRRGRIRWITTTLLAVASVGLAFWKVL